MRLQEQVNLAQLADVAAFEGVFSASEWTIASFLMFTGADQVRRERWARLECEGPVERGEA